MKVLWVSNIVFPSIALQFGARNEIGGGWMLGLLEMMKSSSKSKLSILCFSKDVFKEMTYYEEGISYFVIPLTQNTQCILKNIRNHLKTENYDVIHIFGSEYITSNYLVSVANELGLLDQTLLHIQGLVSVYSKHFSLGVPYFWTRLFMPRDLIKNTSIYNELKEFKKRGIQETITIKLLKHIGGRTEWDKACTNQINPKALYHHCGEILRKSFYGAQWGIKDCERYSMFVSQGNYPIKGLHHAIEALAIIIRQFPQAKLYVAGYSIVKTNQGFMQGFKSIAYGYFLSRLISKHQLEKNIIFTGPLLEKEMLKRYLQSHVFIVPSNIENSPNSLGEAMILGMPCVASFVGGIPDMLRDKVEGFLYPSDAPYMLAYYVMKLFADDELCLTVGAKAREHALTTHDKINIFQELENTYERIAEKD